MPSQLDRAKTAALAAERLATALAGGVDDQDDAATVAYLTRLLEAAAKIEDYAQHALRNVRPDPTILRHQDRTSAGLYGNTRD